MPHTYAAPQFRTMVVEQLRQGRKGEVVATELGVHPATLYRWKRPVRIDRGELARTPTQEAAQLRAARLRIVELEAELATVRQPTELLSKGRVVRPRELMASWRHWLRRVTGQSASAGCSALRLQGASCGERSR